MLSLASELLRQGVRVDPRLSRRKQSARRGGRALHVLREGDAPYPCVALEDHVKHRSETASSFRIAERDMSVLVREFRKASQQAHRFMEALPPLGRDPQ